MTLQFAPFRHCSGPLVRTPPHVSVLASAIQRCSNQRWPLAAMAWFESRTGPFSQPCLSYRSPLASHGLTVDRQRSDSGQVESTEPQIRDPSTESPDTEAGPERTAMAPVSPSQALPQRKRCRIFGMDLEQRFQTYEGVVLFARCQLGSDGIEVGRVGWGSGS